MTTQLLRLWFDHPRIGCGWRQFILRSKGPKWARLVCLDNGDGLEIERQEFDAALRKATTPPPSATRAAPPCASCSNN